MEKLYAVLRYDYDGNDVAMVTANKVRARRFLARINDGQTWQYQIVEFEDGQEHPFAQAPTCAPSE